MDLTQNVESPEDIQTELFSGEVDPTLLDGTTKDIDNKENNLSEDTQEEKNDSSEKTKSDDILKIEIEQINDEINKIIEKQKEETIVFEKLLVGNTDELQRLDNAHEFHTDEMKKWEGSNDEESIYHGKVAKNNRNLTEISRNSLRDNMTNLSSELSEKNISYNKLINEIKDVLEDKMNKLNKVDKK